MIYLSPLSLQIFQEIRRQKGRAFIVGGAIRDDLLQKDIHDMDVEVYGLTYQDLYTLLQQFGKVREMGKSFGILKVDTLPTVDFALPRIETQYGLKHQDFRVDLNPFLDYREACSRRDFTINSILYDPLLDEYIDPFDGRKDLARRLLRYHRKETFKEDPLRVLRLAQFVSRLDFDVEENTLKAAQEMVEEHRLDHLSQERIQQEYQKLLLGMAPEKGLEVLEHVGALPPLLARLTTTPQRLDYHPEGCVFNHVKLVVQAGSRVKNQSQDPLGFMWACLLHDVGKGAITTIDGHAPYHAKIGRKMAEAFVQAWIPSKKRQKYVLEMIEDHMILMNMMLHGFSKQRYYLLLEKIDGILPLNDLIFMSKCDKIGRYSADESLLERFGQFMKEIDQKYGHRRLEPLIKGQDLIEEGFQPSKQFQDLLKQAYLYQLKDYTKEEIIDMLKEYKDGTRKNYH